MFAVIQPACIQWKFYLFVSLSLARSFFFLHPNQTPANRAAYIHFEIHFVIVVKWEIEMWANRRANRHDDISWYHPTSLIFSRRSLDKSYCCVRVLKPKHRMHKQRRKKTQFCARANWSGRNIFSHFDEMNNIGLSLLNTYGCVHRADVELVLMGCFCLFFKRDLWIACVCAIRMHCAYCSNQLPIWHFIYQFRSSGWGMSS